MCVTITFAPECYRHLSSHTGSSWSMQAWFIKPQGLPRPLSLFMFLSHLRTHTFIYTENPHPEGPQREGEKWLLSFPSFNWGSAAFSVTEPRRGGHQKKEKPFTLYCLLPQRAHLSFSHSIYPPFYICLSCSSSYSFYQPLLSARLSIFYKVWHFGNTLQAWQKHTEYKKKRWRTAV